MDINRHICAVKTSPQEMDGYQIVMSMLLRPTLNFLLVHMPLNVPSHQEMITPHFTVYFPILPETANHQDVHINAISIPLQLPENFCRVTPGPNATHGAEFFQFSLSSPVHPTANYHLDITDMCSLKVVPTSQYRCNNAGMETEQSSREGTICTRLKAVSQVSQNVAVMNSDCQLS